ncbi:hypothetical protein G1H11_02165 [Phytoactinopolyspora alkaliphila]|uniref:Uncharacterized protein n=1 Tax=Phytoactinopolyspora alkaliphila TaxID=1783498 RepID=A0A6N9YGV3_9ACTN|nr:hypothetical protein [Phytoactinopolyspora alkaliphila]NED94109.1 hypothetical protein [Phytoactinopolyspora alkaliphila]
MRQWITPTRRGIGASVALVGALGVAASVYLSWYASDGPRDWPLQQLFQASPAGTATAYWGSVAAPLAVVGLLGALGALLRFRFILGLGWIIGSATFILWSIMRAIDDEWRTQDLESGAWLCVAGLVVLLGGILAMGPRQEEVEAPLRMFDDDPPQ